MDNFIQDDVNTFISQKSIPIFSKLNKVEINPGSVELEKIPLSGISNTIFMVRIKSNDEIFSKDKIFFKIFGRISVLVDRDLETYIMQSLCSLGIGPQVYETDMKTYRIEEFLEGVCVLKRENMLTENVSDKIISLFCKLNSLGDYRYYLELIGLEDKSIFFEKLKKDDKSNFINFLLKKILPLANDKFKIFKEKILKDEMADPLIFDETKLKLIENYLNNFEKVIYETLPNQGVFVLSHNDAHPLNILERDNMEKIILCDFEFSNYNLLGFDISNYLIESLYLLENETHPFYQKFSQNYEELSSNEFFEIYLNFFKKFLINHSENFGNSKEIENVFNFCQTRDYYYRLCSLSALLWFAFAIIYFDYDSIRTKSGYDYFNFAYDRLFIHDSILRKFTD